MSDIAIWLGGALALVLAIFGFGQFKKREGRKEAEDDAMQDDLETGRRIDRVRDLDADSARERLRARKRPGDL